MKYPFVLSFKAQELQIPADCTQSLLDPIQSIVQECSENVHLVNFRDSSCNAPESLLSHDDCDTNSMGSREEEGANGWSESSVDRTVTRTVDSPNTHMLWVDMGREDDGLGKEEGDVKGECNSKWEEEERKVEQKPKLSSDQREYIRFMSVERKKDFVSLEKIRGRTVNILDGLELHAGMFSDLEQKWIVAFVYMLQKMGREGQLKEHTYSEPVKWMRGKGRVTIQFGCCYNYATDKNGNPPGILRNKAVDPIPHLFKLIIRRLVAWHVLPPSCIPDSCIVNIYEKGDCIPPHIDNHDFVRPFCTVSFLSECSILFGSNLKIAGPGEFIGSTAIPLPVGSVLVLNGNGADVAKHCVPSVPAKRISITFRKMDDRKRPRGFALEPDLQGILPLPYCSEKPKKSRPSNPQLNSTRRLVPWGNSEGEQKSYGKNPHSLSIQTRLGHINRHRVRLNMSDL
ncbi:RNA demethylase ALKBH9B-like [Tasmannia lanceolata]|uniref:RNA demethylase ALKBH9B-like n=1 Tax=Tasmannia lanceolata TaxID=3420 RepID=UPI004063144E